MFLIDEITNIFDKSVYQIKSINQRISLLSSLWNHIFLGVLIQKKTYGSNRMRNHNKKTIKFVIGEKNI